MRSHSHVLNVYRNIFDKLESRKQLKKKNMPESFDESTGSTIAA